MKKFAIALVAGVMLATGVQFAQAGGACPMSKGESCGNCEDKMAMILDLNDKQKASVKELADAKGKKMKPAFEQMEAAAKSAHSEFEAGVKKILTAKQQAKMEAWMGMEKGGKCGSSCSH